MRTIDDHKVNPANDTLTITVMDEPGAGGAHHHYDVSGFDGSTNPSSKSPLSTGSASCSRTARLPRLVSTD